MHPVFKIATLTALSVTAIFAGPPLICHPFEIGPAKSLPWSAGSNWNNPDPSYDTSRLISDTMNLLSPQTPILARMETMRRATIYASKDEPLAAALIAKVSARISGGGSADSLAWFDAGYLTETYRQLNDLTRSVIPKGQDGYAWTLKAIRMGGSEVPAMEYAASMIQSHTRWPNEHFAKAKAGAKQGSLLAINIAKFE